MAESERKATKIDFTPVIKALCLVAGEVHKLAKQAESFGGLASGDFHTPTYGPSKDKDDEITSVVKANDPGASGVDEEAKDSIIEEDSDSSQEHPGG